MLKLGCDEIIDQNWKEHFILMTGFADCYRILAINLNNRELDKISDPLEISNSWFKDEN